MLKNISSTLFIMVLAMLSSFAVTILLGRTLSASDFGEFTLLKQILLIGSTVAVFGLDYSYIKNFANQNPVSLRTHLFTLFIFVTISAIFVVVLEFLYAVDFTKLLYIYFCILFGAINFYIAAIERLNNRFLLAQLFAHGWKIALLILVGILLLTDIEIDIKIIYPLFTLSLFIGSTFMIRYLLSHTDNETRDIGVKNYLTFGLMFWLINSTGLVSGGIDKLVIPILFGSDTLGVYAAVSFLFVISLTMVGSAIGYVIFPKISSGEQINVKKWSLIVLVLCISAIVVYQFVGSFLVSLIFSGKYDAYVSSRIILTFSVIGSLQIIHTILHFVISAKGHKHQLMSYWFISILFILLFVALLYFGQIDNNSALMRISTIVMIVRSAKIVVMAIFLKILIENNADNPPTLLAIPID